LIAKNVIAFYTSKKKETYLQIVTVLILLLFRSLYPLQEDLVFVSWWASLQRSAFVLDARERCCFRLFAADFIDVFKQVVWTWGHIKILILILRSHFSVFVRLILEQSLLMLFQSVSRLMVLKIYTKFVRFLSYFEPSLGGPKVLKALFKGLLVVWLFSVRVSVEKWIIICSLLILLVHLFLYII
jgi:hypothetical protein